MDVDLFPRTIAYRAIALRLYQPYRWIEKFC